LIAGDDETLKCTALERVPLSETRVPGSALPADERVSELFLQRVLDKSPELLPIQDIDERVEPPLFSLGREIQTSVGAIDNLFISRNGYLVVVETKLWRNPEARRQVIAQVIDYAAQL